MTKAKAAKAEPGHNVQDEREAFIEQIFHNTLGALKRHKSNIAGEMAEMKDWYDRAKSAGIPKSVFKWIMEIEEKDLSEVIRDLEWKLKAARWRGLSIGRQLDILEDRTPLEDRAYEEGLAAGKSRADNSNPYGADSAAGQAWQRGFNDGTEFINKELAAAMDEPFPDEQPAAAEA